MEQTLVSNLQPPSVAATMTALSEGIIRALLQYGAITDYGVGTETLVSVEQLRRVRDTPSADKDREPLLAAQFSGPLFALATMPVSVDEA